MVEYATSRVGQKNPEYRFGATIRRVERGKEVGVRDQKNPFHVQTKLIGAEGGMKGKSVPCAEKGDC